MKQEAFSKRQMQMLWGCFIAYTCAYIGRLNMSVTLTDLMSELHITIAQGGTLQTFFAIVYACGQFGFGALVDHINPRKMIGVGLVGSALCNLAFSFAGTYSQILLIWAVNGFFQSMLWTPIVRLLAENFIGSKAGKASFVMSFSLAIGHLAAWGLAGAMNNVFGWRKAYLLPAVVLLLACAVSLWMMPGGTAQQETARKRTTGGGERMPLHALAATGLILLLLLCVFYGFVRDGVITWSPTILNADKGMFSLIIPCINLVGIAIGASMVRRLRKSVRLVVTGMLLIGFLPAGLLFALPSAPVYLSAVLLGAMSAILQGTNPMLTSIIPMGYQSVGRVGLVAGLIDAFIYLGSALAGVLTGWLREGFGAWQGIYLLWAVCILFAAMTARLSVKGERLLTE